MTTIQKLTSAGFEERNSLIGKYCIYNFEAKTLSHKDMKIIVNKVTRLLSAKEGGSFNRRSFAVMIELLQNVMKHGVKNAGCKLTFAFTSNELLVLTENELMVSYGRLDSYLKLLNWYSSKDPQLKEWYTDELGSCVGNRKLGLLTVARMAKSEFEYCLEDTGLGREKLTLITTLKYV